MSATVLHQTGQEVQKILDDSHDISNMIPEEASSENKLADKNFVGTKVATKLDKFVQIEVPYTYKMVVPVDRDKPYLFRIIATRQDGTVNNELVYIYIKRDSSYYTVISKAFRDWVDINPENIKVYQEGSWPLANFYVSFEPSLSYSGDTTYHITDFDENEIAPSVLQNVPGDTLATIEIERLASGQYVDDIASDIDSQIGNIDVRVQGIEDVIPSSADPDTNQLADKAWVKAVNDLVNYYKKSETYNKSEVDQKIQTETATYKGIFDKWSDVPFDSASYPIDWGGFPPDNNDYIVIRDASLYATKWISGNADGYNVGDYVVEYDEIDNSYSGTYICIEYNAGSMDLPSRDSEHWQRVTENPNYKGTWRFKYVENGEYVPFNFLPEYQINEEPLTPSQIAALDSGITASKVTKLDALPTNSELQTSLAGKQDKYTSLTISAGNALRLTSDSVDETLFITGLTNGSNPSSRSLILNFYAAGDCYAVVTDINGFSDFLLENIVYSDGYGFYLHFSERTVVTIFAISGEYEAEEFVFSPPSEPGEFDILIPEPLSSRQDKLVSGTNIKTINSTSLLGSGDIQISADTSDCVKFGEAISAGNSYLKIDGAGVPFSLMLVVTMDYYTSEYLVNGSEERVEIVKMNGEQSFDGMLRIDDDTYYPIALYHEDSVVVTPILLSGTMPTITDFASASGEEEEIPMFQTEKEVFVAEYGTTTYQQIVSAYNSGKLPVIYYSDRLYVLSTCDYSGTAWFISAGAVSVMYRIRCSSQNNWINDTIYPEYTSNKKSSWSATPTNTNYPTEKLVKDTIDALPVIPSGGTAGQVLTKASGTDYDVEWANGGGGGDTSDCVKYTQQSKTDNEKTTARTNIGITLHDDVIDVTPDPPIAVSYGKMGVISQTQTWSGTGSNPRTYVMSGQVTGLIPQANIDLFEAAGAVFNATTGYFELNGLTDISYEEMKAVYDASCAARSNFRTRESQFAYCDARTILPIIQPYMTAFPTQITTMIYHSACESVGFYALGNPGQPFNVASQGLTNLANTCEKLKKFVGIINISSVTNANSATTPFTNCYSLEDISLKGIKVSVAFGNSPNLSKASLLYMINNEASTSAITITLHASVYAKCQNGGEWYSDISTALAAHTNVSLASA